MDKGMYMALSGSMAQQRRVDTLTNNLANINTTGFKEDALVFQSYLENAKGGTVNSPAEGTVKKLAYVTTDDQYTNFSQGSLVHTGNELDIALEGRGFLVVETAEGHMYTRNGNLKIGQDGLLKTSENYPVLQKDQNGKYKTIKLFDPKKADGREDTFKAGMELTFSESGKVLVYDKFNSSGTPHSIAEAGKMVIVTFNENSKLIKKGKGLYMPEFFNSPKEAGPEVTIKQGFLERSNVNVVKSMADLISAERGAEAYQKAIQAFDDINRDVIDDVGSVS